MKKTKMIDLMACVTIWKDKKMYSLSILKANEEKESVVEWGDEYGNREELTEDDIFKMLELFDYWKWGEEEEKALFNQIDEIIKRN